MADLFQTSRTIVVEHLKHIYDEEKLSQEVTCRKFRQVRKEGDRQGHPGVEAPGTSFTTSINSTVPEGTSFEWDGSLPSFRKRYEKEKADREKQIRDSALEMVGKMSD